MKGRDANILSLKDTISQDSRAQCLGDMTTPENDRWRVRSCLYSNICFRPDIGFIFKSSDDDDLNAYSVSLSPRSKLWDDSSVTKLTFVSSKLVGDDLSHSKVSYFPGSIYLYESYNAQNFGHFLGDEVLPAYHLLTSFGLLNEKVQPYRIETGDQILHSCDLLRTTSNPLYKDCTNNYNRMGHLITGETLRIFNDTFTDRNTTYCFENVVAGIGYLADHCDDPTIHGRNLQPKDSHICNLGLQSMFYEFRRYLMQNIDSSIPEIKKQRKGAGVKVVVQVDLSKTRTYPICPEKAMGLKNVARLQEKYGSIDLKYLHVSGMTLKDQARELANTAVFITGGGGGAFSLLFQPRFSTAIVYVGDDNVAYDSHFFPHLGYVNVHYIDSNRCSDGALELLVENGIRTFLQHYL